LLKQRIVQLTREIERIEREVKQRSREFERSREAVRRATLSRFTSESFWRGFLNGLASHTLFLLPFVGKLSVSNELLAFDSARSAWQDVDRLLADSLVEASRLVQATEQEESTGDDAVTGAAPDDRGGNSNPSVAAHRSRAAEESA
jgi:hypothetical protein